MPKYDLVVVPALRLGPHWGLRRDLRNRLLKAAEIYHLGDTRRIAVLGRWTVWYDWLHIKPPITESYRMKKYLINQGVPEHSIVAENHSKDTIGNAYYLKLMLEDRPEIKKLLVVCAKQHHKRVRFLFEKFLGPKYQIEYLTVKAPGFLKNVTGKEAKLLDEQAELLKGVRPGHAEDFRHRLYNSRYYSNQAKSAELSAGWLEK